MCEKLVDICEKLIDIEIKSEKMLGKRTKNSRYSKLTVFHISVEIHYHPV